MMTSPSHPLNNLDLMGRVYRRTARSGRTTLRKRPARANRQNVILSAGAVLGPIEWLLEFAIGLKPDAPRKNWCGHCDRRNGRMRTIPLQRHVASLLAEPDRAADGGFTITIRSDGDFALQIRKGSQHRSVEVHRRTNRRVLTEPSRDRPNRPGMTTIAMKRTILVL